FVPGASGTPIPAGSIVSDEPGGQLPSGYIPTPYMDPLDADAVSKFAAAGIQLPGSCCRLMRTPATRWVVDPNATAGNPYRQYVMTGLGAGLPMRQLPLARGCYS